jgi:hypothetical protein
MNAPKDRPMDGDDDDLWESWFEQGELAEVSGEAPYEDHPEGRQRAVVIAAISAAALTLMMVFAV